MKLFVLAAGLLTATPAVAQVSASAPLKKSNVIVVRTPDSLSVAYDKLGRSLLAGGYGLDKTNKEMGFIQTTPRATSRLKTVNVVAQFVLKREPQCTVIEVRGTYALASLLRTPISNRGQGGSPAGAAWEELKRAASLYPAGIVAYRIEP